MSKMNDSAFATLCCLCLCLLTFQVYSAPADSIVSPVVHRGELKLSLSRDLKKSHDLHHRNKRGFRSGVADRIAHGFGKRKMPVYTGVNRLADLLNPGYREDDLPVSKIG